MSLHDGVQGRHPVEEAPRTAALGEKRFAIDHSFVDSPSEPLEWDPDEGTIMFTRTNESASGSEAHAQV